MSYRLGRLPHSPGWLTSIPHHKFGAIAPSPTLDRHKIEFVPELYQNNILPVCTAVGLANSARAVAALNGFDIAVNPAKVPEFYASVVGCPPTIQAMIATEGAVLLDVLHKQEQRLFDIGPEALVASWKPVDHTSRSALALCMDRFGVAYVGVTLHERDMDTVGQFWDVEPGRDDGDVVGGHCVCLFDYTSLPENGIVRIGTWGMWQNATWAWVNSRIDEAYGLVWPQLVRATEGTFWHGLSVDEMLVDLG